jgi:hypothetical protein
LIFASHLLQIADSEGGLLQLGNWDFLFDSRHLEHAYLRWRLALFVDEALALLVNY